MRASPEAQVQEVAEGTFAYVQPPGGWCVNNCGILVGRDGTALIDTVATRSRASLLAGQVARLSDGPVRTIVNTHHHGDHTFGNCAFGPSVTVIAHERAPAEILGSGLELTRQWPAVEWGEIEIVAPSVTFQDRLNLHIDDRRVELLHLGPAHTTGDVVAWLPAERVLFTGDIVLSGCAPFMLTGSVSGSLSALRRLRALDPVTVVPGHGPVCGPDAIDTTERYFREVLRIAEAGLSAGMPVLDAAREADLGDLAELRDGERIVANLHRAYAELQGAPPGSPMDVPTVFRETVEYNGGALPQCLA